MMAPNICISDFPAEIIAHIFLQGTRSQQATSPYSVPYPFLPSQVCTTWRTIALNFPALWTVVVAPFFYQPAGLHCMSLTNSWIKRSGALPISVILDARFTRRKGKENTGMVSPGLMQMMLRSVIESAGDRLRRLDICIPSHPTLGHKDYTLLQKASNLEHLTVVSVDMFLTTEVIGSVFFDASALWNDICLPHLRTLRCSGPSVPMLPNLTTMSAIALSMTYEDMHAFFNGSPHLSHLILDQIRPISGVPQLLPGHLNRIEVPSLTHIAIRCQRDIGVLDAHIFNFLDIRHLSYLELDGSMSITQLFGNSIPHIAESLRTLLIANYSDASLTNSNRGRRDVEAIQSFHCLQHLYLLHAPSQLLRPNLRQPQTTRNSSNNRSGSISRLRSELLRELRIDPTLAVYGRLGLNDTNEFTPSDLESRSQPALWPRLCHVTFDSLLALDISELCNWIKEHPTLAVLDLSSMALRHVEGSVHRRGDIIFPIAWKPYTSINEDDGAELLQDVKDWLSARVHLRVMNEKCRGMLYNRVFHVLGEELP